MSPVESAKNKILVQGNGPKKRMKSPIVIETIETSFQRYEEQ